MLTKMGAQEGGRSQWRNRLPSAARGGAANLCFWRGQGGIRAGAAGDMAVSGGVRGAGDDSLPCTHWSPRGVCGEGPRAPKAGRMLTYELNLGELVQPGLRAEALRPKRNTPWPG
jgi:hypothetical protein